MSFVLHNLKKILKLIWNGWSFDKYTISIAVILSTRLKTQNARSLNCSCCFLKNWSHGKEIFCFWYLHLEVKNNVMLFQVEQPIKNAEKVVSTFMVHILYKKYNQISIRSAQEICLKNLENASSRSKQF